MTESLPKGWAEAELGTVLSLANGFAFKPSHWGKAGLPIIRIQNLNNPDAPFNYYDGTLPDRVRVKNGDLLFAWSGTPGTSFGAHIWNGGNAWLNQHIFRVSFDHRLFDKTFLKYAINRNLDRYIAQAHGGAGLAHITKGMFETSTLQISPLSEQRRIVLKFEELLAKLRYSQERVANISVFLRRFRQSVLAAACSGRLTADWREEDNNDALSHGRIADSQADSNIEKITDTPDEWTWATLNSVCDPNRSICYGVIKLGLDREEGVPCLRTSDVKPLRIDSARVKRIDPLISGQFGRTVLRGGEVLVNVRGTLGGVAVVPSELRGWNISREVAVVPVVTANQDYIAFWIASLAAQGWLTAVVKGVAYSGINIEDLRQLPVAIPSLSEQDEIVKRVKTLFALADKIETRYAAVKRQVDRLPQSILAKAFRGELVPTEAELAQREGRPYESGKELLNRIRTVNGGVVGSREDGPRASQNTPIIDGISLDGFSEAVTIDKLRETRCAQVPEKSGVYLIIRSSVSPPHFLRKCTGGWFKGLDPSYPLKVVHENRVEGAHVMYVGMTAGEGGLRNRLCDFFDFGSGKCVGHRGGRLLWHLEDSGELLVRWRTSAANKADSAETAAIAGFKFVHDGRRPFANMAK